MKKKSITPKEKKEVKEMQRVARMAQKAIKEYDAVVGKTVATEKPTIKPALQALLIAPDHAMRTHILYGGKTITIREGHRDYKPGPVMICCHIVPWAVLAEITNVRHCTLREVAEEEYQADDFLTQEDLLEGLQKFYPNMILDSPVTVIRWKNVKGFLADHMTEYRIVPEKLYSEIKHR